MTEQNTLGRIIAGAGAAAILASSGAAFGQAWVEFENETSTRLVAPNGLVQNDTEEKDYAWADFDLDGDIDLAVVRKQPFTTAGKRANVLLMNEEGVLVDRTAEFASASNFPGDQGFLTPTNDRDVLAVDVNHDGWVDLVTGPTYSNGQKHITHPRVYLNLGVDGNGDWQGFLYDEPRIPNMSNVAGPNGCHIDAGDVTGDGFVDLWFINYNNAAGSQAPADLTDAKLLVNDGDGFFLDQTNQRLTGQMVDTGFGASGYVVDINGDGVLDLTKQSAGTSSQIYNDPTNEGFFAFQTNLIGGAVYFINYGDLNNDGRPDFIISDDGADKYMLNQGNNGQGVAQFSTFTYQFDQGGFDDGFGGNSLAADLNNDGFQDVLITDVDIDIPGCGRRMHIYRNLGNVPNVTLREQNTGGAVANIPFNQLTGTHDVAVFDINGDGWLDMVQGRCSGTIIWINQPPTGAVFSYPSGLPANAQPQTETVVSVAIETTGGGELIEDSVVLITKINDGPTTTTPMTLVPGIDGGLFEGVLPAADCADVVAFRIEAELTGGGTFSDPPAIGAFNEVLVSEGIELTLQTFEEPAVDWTVTNDPSVTNGGWEQGEPIGTEWAGQQAAPEGDAEADQVGLQAFVTGVGVKGAPAGVFDLDGGPTILTSPIIDIDGADASITYSRWAFSSDAGNPAEEDALVTEISNDAGDTWVFVDSVVSTNGEWETVNFTVSDFVEPTGQVQVRFVASDVDNNSITEAGVDVFTISEIICDSAPACPGDLTGDDAVDSADLNILLGAFGDNADGDLNEDGATDSADLNILLGAFGDSC